MNTEENSLVAAHATLDKLVDVAVSEMKGTPAPETDEVLRELVRVFGPEEARQMVEVVFKGIVAELRAWHLAEDIP